ncbi:MAG: hypothetical protein LBN05_06795 [Oscillospiraceae bacterium]|jgi:hypothetical protein|nr:hypothetical protein [Oscillospiraceae bacterium]
MFKKNHTPESQAHDALSADVLQAAQIAQLEQRLEAFEAKYDALYFLTFNAMDDRAIGALLRAENDYARWFELLKFAAHRFLVVFTVKDTPGDHVPAPIMRNLFDAGFTQFRTALWRTYVGIVSCGNTIAQEANDNEVRSDYVYTSLDGRFIIDATSQAWRNGNCGDIIINEENCAANGRGINIVVYDVEKYQVVDSIAADFHELDKFQFRHRSFFYEDKPTAE